MDGPESPASPYRLIESNRALTNACARWAREPYIALDTEFERSRTFYARAGLIQVLARSRGGPRRPHHGYGFLAAWRGPGRVPTNQNPARWRRGHWLVTPALRSRTARDIRHPGRRGLCRLWVLDRVPRARQCALRGGASQGRDTFGLAETPFERISASLRNQRRRSSRCDIPSAT